MDDRILPDETPDPTQAPAPPAPVQDMQRMDRLESAMQELTRTVADAAQRLTQSPQAPPPQTADQFLSELAQNPQELIRREASAAARQVAAEQLTPALLRTLELASHQILSEQAQKVDQEIGAGTFDELFRPQLEKDIAQLRQVNPQALADRGTMEALVNRLYGGENFPVLMEKRRNLEQLARSRGLSHLVPTGGVPRLRNLSNEPELTPDAELFLREVDRATGENTDRKSFTKLMNTGSESGPGRHRTTVIEYLKAIGADPDTLKMYGGERQ